jgi:hypothetical protein
MQRKTTYKHLQDLAVAINLVKTVVARELRYYLHLVLMVQAQ